MISGSIDAPDPAKDDTLVTALSCCPAGYPSGPSVSNPEWRLVALGLLRSRISFCHERCGDGAGHGVVEATLSNAALVGSGTRFLAHAFGERYDSPIPLTVFILGGAVIVIASFVMVYRRQPVAERVNVAVTKAWHRPGNTMTGLASAVLLAGVVVAGLVGTQEVSENILPTVFWLLLWVVLPLLVGLVGDFTRPFNPFAAISGTVDRGTLRQLVIGTREPLAWPTRIGYWVAVVEFVVVVAGELIVNTQATLPRVTAVGLIVYSLISLTGGLVFGREAWCAQGELFSVLFATWGRLGFWRFGAPGRRGFAGGLGVGFAASWSQVVFVLLLLGSVTFDGLLSTPQWTSFTTGLPWLMGPGTTANTIVATLALLAVMGLMLTVFGLFAKAVSRAGRHGDGFLAALTGLLASLLPIAYGYLLAHYLQYVVVNGQLLIPLVGDPLGTGHSVLPYPFNDEYAVNVGILPTSVIWYFQMVVIVLAHVIAVVLAHRRLAARSAEPALARRAEWPWLVAMVCYTMLSLWLLAQPLIEQGDKAGESPTAAAQSDHG
jgi:hypothetical protein